MTSHPGNLWSKHVNNHKWKAHTYMHSLTRTSTHTHLHPTYHTCPYTHAHAHTHTHTHTLLSKCSMLSHNNIVKSIYSSFIYVSFFLSHMVIITKYLSLRLTSHFTVGHQNPHQSGSNITHPCFQCTEMYRDGHLRFQVGPLQAGKQSVA